MLASIEIPAPEANSFQKFYKRGSRATLTLSRISLGCYLAVEKRTIKTARFAAGSMSAFPERLYAVEKFIEGQILSLKQEKKP
ncbi:MULTISPECIES: hypothetical protein [Aminobacterium]|jgi:CO/xanthine dehydrogenase FAD-binding subunit|uniref:hypothetical protein n=1 Tax=Aminobacterium TaxID=81466 RepID=UPI002580081B|nr:hypothetical protein [Aminobacterium sp. UBA4987]